MGHEDVAVSFEVYGRKISDQAKRQAAAALDSIFDEVTYNTGTVNEVGDYVSD